jgi:hypothetical protein
MDGYEDKALDFAHRIQRKVGNLSPLVFLYSGVIFHLSVGHHYLYQQVIFGSLPGSKAVSRQESFV